MRFIHELAEWPKFDWKVPTVLIGQVRHQQGRLLGRMESLGFTLCRESSLINLTEDVVKSSAIEGEFLNPEQVRSSIARRLGIPIDGEVQVSRDVEGIVELMLDATQNYDQPLTADRLFAWHAALFPSGRSGMRKITVGAWRTAASGAMQVVSGPLGNEKVHFEAPHAERLDSEMTTFLEWFETKHGMDPVMKAAIAHFWFVTIHPFEDGNGRIGRAITDLLLARADGMSNRFYSMSSQIEAERKEYYLQLERSQRGTLDITSWLEWFIQCMLRALEGTEQKLSSVLRKSKIWEVANRVSINERQRNVINRLLDGFEGNLNTSKYAKLAKCSVDTALRDISSLVDGGILIQNSGGGRSTSYSLAEI
ncbi:MAG: Fic family protein [Verrucomicrobiota bacterium]